MRTLITVGMLISITNLSTAQEEKHFTQFSFNKIVFNPGYAGNADAMTFTAMYRNQWTTIEGAPVTINLNAHTPIQDSRAGVGLSIVSDQIGIFQRLQVDASYSYKLPVSQSSTLSIGLSAGLDVSAIQWQDADSFDAGDSAIPTANGSVTRPNFGVGFFLSGEQYFVGLSAPRILRSPLFLEEEGDLLGKRPYYLMSGLVIPVNKTVQLKPAALVSLIPNAPFEVDFSLSALFVERLWVGGAYRLGDSFGGMIQYEISNQFQIGASFDFTLSEFRRFNGETMEFMMRYFMSYTDSEVRNIRYF